MANNLRNLLFAGAGAWTALIAGSACAQPASPAQKDAGARGEIEEIVVTASRREESIQKSSLSVTALSAASLGRSGVTQISDLGSLLPGVTIGDSGAHTQIYIRGVGSFVGNALADGAVSVNADQAYIARPYGYGGLFHDVERVEVLKGPQGTLYGRNASGGAMNIITRDPTVDGVNGYANLELGNYNNKIFDGALNVPLSNVFAVRASVQIGRRDGYLSDGSNDLETEAYRLKFLLEPSDVFSTVVSLDWNHQGGAGGGAVFHPPGVVDVSNPWVGVADSRSNTAVGVFPPIIRAINPSDLFQDNTEYGASAIVKWKMSWATLTLIPAYRESKLDNSSDDAGGLRKAQEKSTQWSFEGRLSNSGERLNWVAGVYYFNERLPNALQYDFGLALTADLSTPKLDDESYAAFAEANYRLAEGLRLIAGVRYTHENKAIHGQFTFVPGGVPVVVPFDQDASYNATNWKAGIEYDLRRDSMLYATVATGFKAGGFFASGPPNTYLPEKLTAYTVGARNRFFDRKLLLNIELFHWDYDNHQESGTLAATDAAGQSIPGAVTFGTVNAGKATSEGVELTVAYQLTPHDLFTLDGEYNHTRYDSFLVTAALPAAQGCATSGVFPVVTDCSGRQIVRSALWSATMGYQHIFELKNGGELTASVNSRLSGPYWLGVNFVQNFRTSSYTLTELNLIYTAPEGWSLGAYARNLENAAVYTSAFPSVIHPELAYATIGAPRTFGVQLGYHF